MPTSLDTSDEEGVSSHTAQIARIRAVESQFREKSLPVPSSRPNPFSKTGNLCVLEDDDMDMLDQ